MNNADNESYTVPFFFKKGKENSYVIKIVCSEVTLDSLHTDIHFYPWKKVPSQVTTKKIMLKDRNMAWETGKQQRTSLFSQR